MTDAWKPSDFLQLVIVPALAALPMLSATPRRLLLATAMTESNIAATIQRGGGPALGYFQMEDGTHNDIFRSFLNPDPDSHYAGHPALIEALTKISSRVGAADEMAKNPIYAAAMARIFYFRAPDALPEENNLEAIWEYYKKHWNTWKGAATRQHFMLATAGVMAL